MDNYIKTLIEFRLTTPMPQFGLKFRLLLFICVLFTLSIVMPIIAQENYYIKDVQFKGNTTFSSSVLQAQIVMHPKTELNKLLFWKKPMQFSESLFQDDLDRLKVFYQTEGFLKVNISDSLVQFQKKNSVIVVFLIKEDKPVITQNIQFDIIDNDSSKIRAQHLLDSLKTLLITKQGIRFRDALIDHDKQVLAMGYFNSGFPYVDINPKFKINTDDYLVDITFDITTGIICYFGNVAISGNDYTSSGIIRKQIAFKQGEVFNQEKIQESQRHIYQLGVFQYVTLKTLLEQREGHHLPVQVIIKEAPRLTSKLGVGYGTEDNFRISLDIRRMDFLGGSRRLIFSGQHSSLEPYNLGIKFIQPAFLNPKASLTLNPFVRQEKEPGYTIDRRGGNISFQQRFTLTTDAYLNYSLEQDALSVSQITREQALENLTVSLYNKSSITFGLAYDNSSPLLYPVHGNYITITTTYSGLDFRSDFHYARVLLEAKRYQPVYKGLLLALRIKWGTMKATVKNEVTPIEERFYSGGSSSIRGWARSQVGPKSSDGAPLGGNSIYENSFEFRFPIWKSLGGVGFLDYGNVWRSFFEYHFNDLYYAGGFGLRYKTPIGPFRLDIAYPLSEPEASYQFYITVGQAF